MENVENTVREGIGSKIVSPVTDKLGNQAGDQVWNKVRDPIGEQTSDQLWIQVIKQVQQNVKL
jgi:hypothetical protein